MPVGARGLTDVFGVKKDHTGFVQADYTTAAAALADKLHRFGADSGTRIIESTDWNYTDDGVPTLKIAQTAFDEAYQGLIDLLAPKKAGAVSAVPNEKTAENGRKIGGSNSAGDAKNAMIVHYGSLNEDEKIPVTVNLAYFRKTSGARSSKGGDFLTPAVDVTGLPAQAEMSIPAEFFDPTIVTVSTAQVFRKDYYEEVYFLDPVVE